MSKSTLKTKLDSWLLICFCKRFRFQCCKYGVCRSKDFKLTSFQSWRSQEKVCCFFQALYEPVCSDSSRTAVESFSKYDGAGNFEVLWPKVFTFTAMKDLKHEKKYTKNQEASRILKVCFALLKWPHFHSTSLVRVPFLSGIGVHNYFNLYICPSLQWCPLLASCLVPLYNSCTQIT